MQRDNYLSTGEAARLLGISRSTVSRRFDTGALRGRTNPVTGERLVSRESVAAFACDHDLQVAAPVLASRRVILAAPAVDWSTALAAHLQVDTRLQLEWVHMGSEALIACAADPPDLLIVGEGLPDIDPADVLSSLGARPATGSVKILAVAGADRTQSLRSAGAKALLLSDDLRDEDAVEEVYRLLRLPRQPPPAPAAAQHERQWTRVRVQMACRIEVYAVSNPQHRIQGTAVVANISRGGAYLTGLRVEGESLPAEPFRMAVHVDQPPLEGWRVDCQVVRLQCSEILSAGLRFVSLSEADGRRIAQLQNA